MKEFLKNHEFWHLRICKSGDCERYCENGANFSDQNEVHKIALVDFNVFYRNCVSKRRCNHTDSVESESFKQSNYLNDNYPLFIIFGVISLIGNGIAITNEILILKKQKHTGAKERKVYNLLKLNLGCADLLMAFYLILYTIALPKINVSLCNALGVVSVLSIQTSVSILVVITAYRLYGVLFPYKHVHIKNTIITLVLIWLVWLIVVSLPVFNGIIFENIFTYGVLIGKNKYIKLRNIKLFAQSSANKTTSSAMIVSQVLNAVVEYTSNEVNLQFLRSFNLVDFESNKTKILEYYCDRRGCTIDILMFRENAGSYFSLGLIIFNLIGFVFIIISYLTIFKNLSKSRIKCRLPCMIRSNEQEHKIKSENRHIYYRIFVVVFTDVICGVFTCCFGLAYFFMNLRDECYHLPHNIKKAMPLIVMILFPLNSIINPYIYSFNFWKRFLKHIKQHLC